MIILYRYLHDFSSGYLSETIIRVLYLNQKIYYMLNQNADKKNYIMRSLWQSEKLSQKYLKCSSVPIVYCKDFKIYVTLC